VVVVLVVHLILDHPEWQTRAVVVVAPELVVETLVMGEQGGPVL